MLSTSTRSTGGSPQHFRPRRGYRVPIQAFGLRRVCPGSSGGFELVLVTRKPRRGLVLTARDRDLIGRTCRPRLVTIALVHRFFFPDAATPEAVSRRLARLAAAGYLRKLDGTTAGGRAIYAATALGHRSVDSPLRVTTAVSTTSAHTLTVAEIALRLHGEGYAVTTEAEIRCLSEQARAGRAEPGLIVWLLADGGNGKTVRQYPDLILEKDGQRTVVEVELTRKSGAVRNRRRAMAQAGAVLRGWYQHIRYYIPQRQPATGRAISSAMTGSPAGSAARTRWRNCQAAGSASSTCRTCTGTAPPSPTSPTHPHNSSKPANGPRPNAPNKGSARQSSNAPARRPHARASRNGSSGPTHPSSAPSEKHCADTKTSGRPS